MNIRINRTWAVIALVVLAVVLPPWINAVVTYNSNIQTCERSNDSRAQYLGLLNDLVKVNQKRIEASNSPAEKEANRQAKRIYASRRDSTLAVLTPTVAGKPGIIDCQRVYAKPFPLNLF